MVQIQICSGPSLQIPFRLFFGHSRAPKNAKPYKNPDFPSAQIRLNPFFSRQAESGWFSLIQSDRFVSCFGSQVHSLHLAAQVFKTGSIEHAKKRQRQWTAPAVFHLQSVSIFPPGLMKVQRLEPTSKKRRKITDFLKNRMHLSKQVCYTQVWVPQIERKHARERRSRKRLLHAAQEGFVMAGQSWMIISLLGSKRKTLNNTTYYFPRIVGSSGDFHCELFLFPTRERAPQHA